LAALFLNFQAYLLFLFVFQWLQSGFHISTLIGLVMHNMEWRKPWKINSNETLDLYQSWKFIPAGIILSILILTPSHHKIGYLELLIPEMVYEFEKCSGTSINYKPGIETGLR
jgi:hypothetical protein